MGLWRAIGVLFWKNWRTKQRESRLNRRRPTTPRAWLAPPLLTDIVLPLALLVYVIGALCDLNRQTVAPDAWQPAGAPARLPMTRASAVEMLTALPLLLQTTNMTLLVVDRPVTRAFLAHLEHEYPGDPALGIPPLGARTRFLPWNNASSDSDETALDDMMAMYPTRHHVDAYAAWDLRPRPARGALEARVLQFEDDRDNVAAAGALGGDQLARYFAFTIKDRASGEPFLFPGSLVVEMEVSRFVRQPHGPGAETETLTDPAAPAHVTPERACRALDEMLGAASMGFRNLRPRNPLGQTVASCVEAIAAGHVGAGTLGFLERLVHESTSPDALQNLLSTELPTRPRDVVSGQLETQIVFYMAYLFLWPFARLVRDIVMEKEKQLKEYLLIMGLQPMALLISWFLMYFVASMVVVVIAVAMLRGKMFEDTAASAWHFFLFLQVFGTSMLLFGIAVTPIFGKTQTAATAAPLLYVFLGVAPFLRSMVGEEAVAETPLHYFVSFMQQVSSPVVFMETLHSILAFDAASVAVRPIAWATIATPSAKMFAQCIGYLILGWYVENVFPRQFGVQRPWHFIFHPSYWFPGRFQNRGRRDQDEDELARLTDSVEANDEETLREMPLGDYVSHFRPTLLVQSLSKQYPNGKMAVRGVSFAVKKGEIFGLLGPNGAGKSTTMSILCGILSPTAGNAFVGSTSVVDDPTAIRKSLSVCFQQNILFDELTVWEHLSLVHGLKTALGIKAVEEELWIHKLRHFGLEEKRDALSKTLSGGQKRKLSLVLALMDTSKLVLLDEPTAGMDLKARTDTWDALKRAVNHRAVILTTHSMQEAEALCENIGIVADGRLKCCGSSLFLREKFGVGYKLTVVHSEFERLDAKYLLSEVQKHTPDGVLVSDNKWETRFQLKCDDPKALIPLLNELENLKSQSRISRYAVAATDLEDVFVRVTDGEDVYYHVKDDESNKLDSSTLKAQSMGSSIGRPITDGEAMPIQIGALFAKRWKLLCRDRRSLLSQYFWPVVYFAILLGIVAHVSTSRTEVITSLPKTSSHSKLFLGCLPGTSAVCDRLLRYAELPTRIIRDDIETETAMIERIFHNDTDTTFFSAVLVRNESSEQLLDFSIYYNQSIEHALPVSMAWISQAHCKAASLTDCYVVVKKSAFPPRFDRHLQGKVSSRQLEESPASKKSSDNPGDRLLLAIYLLIELSIISSAYITNIVKERESGIKRMQYQHMASTRVQVVYWLTNFVFDYCGYFLAASALIGIMFGYGLAWPKDLMLALVTEVLLGGSTVLLFTYLVSLVFGSHSSAQSFVSYAATFQILGAAVFFVLLMIPSTCGWANTVTGYLNFLPLFALSEGLMNIAMIELTPIRQQCLEVASLLGDSSSTTVSSTHWRSVFSANSPRRLSGIDDGTTSPWAWDVAGRSLAFLTASSLGYALLLLLCDSIVMYPTVWKHRFDRLFRRQDLSQNTMQDMESGQSRHIIEVHHLTKVYNPKKSARATTTEQPDGGERPALNENGQVVAVNDVSFAVERNDCVALLGVNGSGKSTTFEILTSGIAPTSGQALINGVNVTTSPQEASRQSGYCPQTNVFFPDMSVYEHLELFYRLRIRRQQSQKEVSASLHALMRRLDLLPVETTRASHLSGGNKRRMMLALSLLSDDVPLLLMDEPSAGVDVVARRLMWKVLFDKRSSRGDVSCLFTTHSMEEAEAVCANAIVLNKGRLVWSGSIPELKHHAARGISITLRLDTDFIWETERVRYFVGKIRQSQSAGLRGGLAGDVVLLDDLEAASDACLQSSPSANCRDRPERSSTWLSGLRSRLEDEQAANSGDHVGVDMVEFVKEWLLREAFGTIETQLFRDLITARSGEVVKPVDLQNAHGSGRNTTAVYETVCTDQFELVDAFRILEEHKSTFGIARYSISELSLERVFEQFV